MSARYELCNAYKFQLQWNLGQLLNHQLITLLVDFEIDCFSDDYKF